MSSVYAAELALGVALDVAQLGHVGKVEHGLAHLEAHRRVDLVDVQQVGLGADEADTSDITMASRIGSIGGLVTCANSCLK
jgi:hypothetical protein